jgi:hypothetical protein
MFEVDDGFKSRESRDALWLITLELVNQKSKWHNDLICHNVPILFVSEHVFFSGQRLIMLSPMRLCEGLEHGSSSVMLQ